MGDAAEEPAGKDREGPRLGVGPRLERLDWDPSWRNDVALFLTLAVLGTVASYISVNIPHTEVYFDVRYAFGYLGFAVLRRWWLALALGLLLSLVGPHKVSLLTAFLANLVYVLPIFVTIRLVHGRLLERLRSLLAYGAGMMALILACYQVFTMPAVGLVLAWLRDAPLWAGVVGFWSAQPFLVESVMAGVIATAGATVLRGYRLVAHREHELAVLLESVGEGVVATDTAGRVTRMNPQAALLTGWRSADVSGRALVEIMTLVNSHTGARVESPVAKVLAEGRTVGLANHTTLISRDGVHRQIADSAAPIRDTDGELLGVVMVFRDVSDEYAAREALEESNRQLDLAVESAGLGIWDWDAKSGQVQLRGWQARLFGFPVDVPHVPVEVFQERVHPEDWEATWAMALQSRDAGVGFDCTFRVIRPDETMIWVRALGKAIHDDHGHIVRVIGTAQDITNVKTAQDQLRDSVNALARSNTELERFAYIASHDLQEPIRNMVAYSQLLGQRYGDRLDGDGRTFLAFIEDGAKRMQALVLDLLDYSRVSNRQRPFTKVDMADVMVAARSNLAEQIAAAGAHVTVGPMPMVRGDFVQLVSLMQNLIGNAVKFRTPGRRPEVSVSARETPEHHVIEVRDNGIGIAPEHAQRIFEIFRRLHTVHEYPGTGVGLALAKRIAECHGGGLSFDSTPGEGSCFRVALPRQNDGDTH
jgi:PAS domain S-box-containing protein